MTLPPDLVSCLCVTHNRVPMLTRAIHCFDRQTWPQRELVLLHEDGDTATRDFLAQLAHPLIRSIVVPTLPRLTQGAKRQLTLQAARGRYIATWDDDDWSAPERIAQQITVMRASGRPASVLERWIIHDQLLNQSWLSYARTWEASLVCERAAMPDYDDVQLSEDTRCLDRLLQRQHVVGARLAHTYIYLYHGNNIGSRAHFKRHIFKGSLQLPPAFGQRVARLLASPHAEPPIGADELQAAATAAQQGAPLTP
ncbi:MAG: glycosyltransferase family 2 protein [Burkholderiales bacterium]|nr:glycosyltransferase family 2 protein [Burkholderiales bacterium]